MYSKYSGNTKAYLWVCFRKIMRNKSKIGVTSAKVSKKLRLKQLRPLGGRPQQQQKQE